MFYLIPHRAEQQRNQALQNAEKLKEAFKEYKATISIKLKRVHFILFFVMFFNNSILLHVIANMYVFLFVV